MSTQSDRWVTAARILRRAGFGATGSDVDAAVESGQPSKYVRDLLQIAPGRDAGVVATPMPDMAPPERPSDVASSEDLDQYGTEVADQMRQLTHWWIRRMVAVEQPVVEKLTFVWHNHFATSARKVRIARLMATQNQSIREHVLGDFASLAYAMLTDAAMIRWLDGQQNKAGSPNENLAREFMELFALGHGGGYTETDVREASRALTGWRAEDDGRAELHTDRHDVGKKSVLGTRGAIGAREFCDIVLAQENSAHFVVGSLWQQLASSNPPSEDIDERLVAAYGRNRDLRALTAAILTDPDFLTGDGTLITSPVEWLIGLLRALKMDIDQHKQMEFVVATLTSLSQLPFYPPDVGGWPRGRDWLATSAAVTRFRAARKLVRRGDLSTVEESRKQDRLDAAGYLLGIGAWSDRSFAALKPLRDDPVSLVVGVVNAPEYLTS